MAKEGYMAKKAVVLLAGGFEEVEAVTPIDYLRRAGIDVTSAAAGENLDVTGSHSIPVRADTGLAELVKQAGGLPGLCRDLDAVLLPGGLPGASNLAASPGVSALLEAMAREGKIIAAICASPAVVLAPLGLLRGKRFTCYPGMEQGLEGTGPWSGDRVVIDGNIIMYCWMAGSWTSLNLWELVFAWFWKILIHCRRFWMSPLNCSQLFSQEIISKNIIPKEQASIVSG
jgi:4-methyl-5(b-hydroxyethyl)-thiazole monophosphate biosynthesis